MSGWQPIETVPKNEMFIWGRLKDNGVWLIGLAYWTHGGIWLDAYCNALARGATHWHPLPDPPEDLR